MKVKAVIWQKEKNSQLPGTFHVDVELILPVQVVIEGMADFSTPAQSLSQ